jgi:hypothetical protein
VVSQLKHADNDKCWPSKQQKALLLASYANFTRNFARRLFRRILWEANVSYSWQIPPRPTLARALARTSLGRHLRRQQ